MMEHGNGFIDSAELTKWIKWFLYLQVGISVIALISGVLEYQLLNDFKDGVYAYQDEAIAAAEESDSRQQVISIIQLLILFVSGFLILKWIYRANFNARQLGASGMRFTPGWSIGWYFLPVVCLWKPYQAMKEIWKASSNPQDWRSQPVPSILPWWWFFWIVSNLLGYASFRIALNAEQINELIVANVTLLFSNITGIPLSLILLAIVNKVYEMQVSHFGKVTTHANP
ncbi:DUF4328 domain-containing protein [Nitrosomonas oligotropha]|uniref:DUF4328 domain-containing protein n=1 Tax=Nitrosomonas oligotropha TaxID=42354 RepID=UPI00136A762D|nr:DUF4328 domain-containing protein [Nitrosomonas oligotropha]MXS81715.1 DUF4328 domain-containing protein [Nitrosomonas oligotropha]